MIVVAKLVQEEVCSIILFFKQN